VRVRFSWGMACGSQFFGSRFFLEEDAMDSEGRLTRPKERAVNKIGHGAFLSFCLHVACVP
jgi:hypothetical protein